MVTMKAKIYRYQGCWMLEINAPGARHIYKCLSWADAFGHFENARLLFRLFAQRRNNWLAP